MLREIPGRVLASENDGANHLDEIADHRNVFESEIRRATRDAGVPGGSVESIATQQPQVIGC